MEDLIKFLEGFQLQTIISLCVVAWYFTRQIKSEFKEEIKAIRDETCVIREEIKEQAKRTDKLYEMFVELLKDRK